MTQKYTGAQVISRHVKETDITAAQNRQGSLKRSVLIPNLHTCIQSRTHAPRCSAMLAMAATLVFESGKNTRETQGKPNT